MSNEKTKFPLPSLGLGAAQIGNLYREVPDEIAEQTVITAWEQGIRYFDTAPHYGLGLSEKRLGKALKNFPRDEYMVSSKVGRLLVPSPETAVMKDEQGFDVHASTKRVWDFSRDGIMRSVEASLERLDLERIDILYLHDPEDHFEQASTEGISALIELREQGIVQAVGAGMNFAAPLAELIRRACNVRWKIQSAR
jgi:D-threo-aldose 1-dehydrogenase